MDKTSSGSNELVTLYPPLSPQGKDDTPQRRGDTGGTTWCHVGNATSSKSRPGYCQLMEDRDGLRIAKDKRLVVNQIRDSPDSSVTWKSGFHVRGDLDVGIELTSKKLCMGDVCIGREEMMSAMKKHGISFQLRKELDHLSHPDDFPHTYTEYRRLCESKGKRMCRRQEICDLQGKPRMYVPNDMIRHDHWIAVSDDVNEWVTLSSKSPCQTWRELHQVTPSWGHHSAKDQHYRGVMCCSLASKEDTGDKK